MKRLVIASAIVLLSWACDPGPSGRGELNGSLESVGPPLGGAVLEVVGKGVEGFSSSGGTRVFSSPTSTPGTHRVVLVNDVPGTLQFRVSVVDLGDRKPTAAVINVISGENLPLPATSEYKVRFSRK
ncbi:hypothetical protein ACFL3S_09960 [Gemmatimonadota bacterium]